MKSLIINFSSYEFMTILYTSSMLTSQESFGILITSRSSYASNFPLIHGFCNYGQAYQVSRDQNNVITYYAELSKNSLLYSV